MILDKVFWLWFIFIGMVSIYMLVFEYSAYGFLFPLILIGMGLDRLADESRKKDSVGADKKILNKLKGKK